MIVGNWHVKLVERQPKASLWLATNTDGRTKEIFHVRVPDYVFSKGHLAIRIMDTFVSHCWRTETLEHILEGPNW